MTRQLSHMGGQDDTPVLALAWRAEQMGSFTGKGLLEKPGLGPHVQIGTSWRQP